MGRHTAVIAGPSVPRTVQELEAIAFRQADTLEWGLEALASDFDLGDVGRAAVLARDAVGAPVLVFVDDPAGPPVTLNAARVHAHLVANAWLLQRVFPHRLPTRLGDGLRVLVLGYGFDALGLAALRALALPDLTVLEVHEWSLGGQITTATRAVFSRPTRADATFSPPSGIDARDAAALASELLSWLARLDTDVVIDGDRFARHVRARGRPLCTVVWHDGAPWVLLPDGARHTLHGRADAIAAMDSIMRLFREALTPTREPVFGKGGELSRLRQTVGDVRLSRAELHALQAREGDLS